MKTQTQTPDTRNDRREGAPRSQGFAGRLASIRARGDRRREDSDARRREDLADHARRLLATFEFVDRAREALALRLADLGRDLLPGMTLDQRVFDGRWLVAGRLQEDRVDERGRPEGAYSRAAFLLETGADGDAAIRCHLTVRGRDLPVLRRELTADDAGCERLAAFAEECLLDFARAWCAGQTLRRAG